MHILNTRCRARRQAGRTLLAAAVLFISMLTGCQSNTGSLQRPAAVEKYIEGAKSYQSGDLEKATAELSSAVRANPNLVMARIMLGDIYIKKSDFRSAKEQYLVLTSLDPYT